MTTLFGETVSARVAGRIACLLAAGLLAACATNSQSFKRVPNTEIDAGYIASDADFGRYRRLLPKDMGIYFPARSPLSESEIQHLRDIFNTAFRDELEGYEIARKPAPDALLVQATLIDLRKATFSEIPDVRPEIRPFARPGKLMFLMELRDSKSARVLARAVDTAASPAFADDTATDEEAAARRWARLFRDFLDGNLGCRRDTSCP